MEPQTNQRLTAASPETAGLSASNQARPRSPRHTLARAVLISALILLGGDLYAHWVSGTSLWPWTSVSDRLSAREQANRALAFSQLGSLPLEPVAAAYAPKAIEAMSRGLPEQARKALVADLAPTASSTPQPAARNEPARLVWITLWDTDVEDGDVVRLDSGGYSRTVTLTKGGGTFAVPVPVDGIVTVTGIRDGDGGGITVGLASGPARAVFPIMSVGQSLHLRVAPQ